MRVGGLRRVREGEKVGVGVGAVEEEEADNWQEKRTKEGIGSVKMLVAPNSEYKKAVEEI